MLQCGGIRRRGVAKCSISILLVFLGELIVADTGDQREVKIKKKKAVCTAFLFVIDLTATLEYTTS
jgi:hypothetical protein